MSLQAPAMTRLRGQPNLVRTLYAEREGYEMSAISEWVLQVHRAIWFPVLYAMGLEGQSVEVMDGRFRYTGAGFPQTVKPMPRRRQRPRRKAA
jgi:hypothetical protein